LGLLVSTGGYPLAYELFEGSKFEGHTMIPVIETFKEKYKLEKLVVVADAGLLSTKNIKALCEKNYEFILGARIKNETLQDQQHLLSLKLSEGGSTIIDKGNGQKLIVSYSDGPAKTMPSIANADCKN
jgi:transposase